MEKSSKIQKIFQKFKFVLPIFAIAMICLISTPITAYAGVISSSGSGSSGGGGGGNDDTYIGTSYGVPGPFCRWSGAYAGDVNWTTDISYSDKYGGQSLTHSATRWACVQKQVRGGKYKNFRWIWWMRYLLPPGDQQRRGYGTAWVDKNIADAEMQQELNRCSTWDDYDMLWKDNSTGAYVDIVFKEGWQETKTDTRKTIVYAEGGDFPLMTDRRSESPQSLYDNPTYEIPYSGKSGQTEMNHKKLIEAWFMPVTRTETYMTDGVKKWNINVTYKAGSTQYFSKNIHYDVKQPSISQSWFKPFDLNRNGVALDEDVKRDYPEYNGGQPLKMTVDNKQNITDGRKLKTLDTNTSLPFTIRFQNNQLGFPNEGDGGVNLSQQTPGSSFANGDGSYRGEVINSIGFNGSIKTGEFYADGMNKQNVNGNLSKDVAWNPNVKIDLDSNSGSLTYNGTEKIGGEPFSFGLDWQGGDFSFKTTKIGEYHLFNNGRKWWEMSYEKGKFYSYGVEYKGIIKIDSGISNPSIVNSNLYSKLASKSMIQPILRGVFEAKTIGGNIG